MGNPVSELIGRLPERFVVEREIGRGGMGVVLLAQDRKHNRRVALKVLEPALAKSLGTSRFLREIEIAAGLTHPHIVSVFDSGDTDGLLYYVMPFIEGESVAERLRREGPFPVETAVAMIGEVADALGYAHERGVIHRDLKPGNILLSGGHALLADFGIARLMSTTADSLTATGVMVGTVAYASPEQLGGAGAIDARADQYSLGCVCYEMLAGEPPYSGPNPQTVALRHFGAPVPSVRLVRPAVPEWTDQAIQRALAKAPADRFASVKEFAAALAQPPLHSDRALRSIAVLPFTNLSPDPDTEYFSDGITEEIITALAQVPALQVAARTSSFAFKGRTDDIRRIGQQLGVAAVLEGSIRRAGGRLRVTAQLISVADGYHLWSERFDRQLEDVFAIQDEIAGRIAEALGGLLGRPGSTEAVERFAPRDLEAYDLYLRGRELMHQFRRKQFERARDLFRAAVQRDPSFARAWAGIAQASSYLYTTFDASPENSGEADESSRRAVELAPELAETRTARGYALAINQRFDEAWSHFEAAFRTGPRDFDAWYLAGRAAWLAGDRERAVRYFERAAEVRPEDYQALGLASAAYEGLGDSVNARRCQRLCADRARRWLDLYPNDVRALYLGGIALARLGDIAGARASLERAASMDPEDPATVYNVACGLAVLGDVERAIDCLERCYQMGFAHHDWIRNDPDLNPLRNHPRFQALIRSA